MMGFRIWQRHSQPHEGSGFKDMKQSAMNSWPSPLMNIWKPTFVTSFSWTPCKKNRSDTTPSRVLDPRSGMSVSHAMQVFVSERHQEWPGMHVRSQGETTWVSYLCHDKDGFTVLKFQSIWLSRSFRRAFQPLYIVLLAPVTYLTLKSLCGSSLLDKVKPPYRFLVKTKRCWTLQ